MRERWVRRYRRCCGLTYGSALRQELKIGRNLGSGPVATGDQVAFKSRTHRRIFDKRDNVADGGGWKWHRPWEKGLVVKIYMVDGKDVSVYEIMGDLLRSVEPEDVSHGQYTLLENEGRSYQLVVEGRGYWREVRAVVINFTPDDVALLESLRQEYGCGNETD